MFCAFFHFFPLLPPEPVEIKYVSLIRMHLHHPIMCLSFNHRSYFPIFDVEWSESKMTCSFQCFEVTPSSSATVPSSSSSAMPSKLSELQNVMKTETGSRMRIQWKEKSLTFDYGVLDRRIEYMSLGKYFVEKLSIPEETGASVVDEDLKKKRIFGTSLEFYVTQIK
eukprot:TRINITY_DN1718_c0_g1_i2.p1 TRINITY_DN1718_c0_g1~~TRINITY_DN1718_c0_g1_i2.p1  ORF type:complete len:167 (-),score=36.97 TRINITY_DN1718_c0_g1_i2:16-516(-)